MSMFVSRAACRGHRPAAFSSRSWFQRSSLIGMLLRERDVARFIVAPQGYGKTLLAVDYAETMFSWEHTFWLSGDSPCFIRDLDAHDIAASCIEVDDEVSLVVIDDLPLLDLDRAMILSDEIDLLLKRGCEVIVSCVPSRDVMADRQPSRLRLGARELLLSDAEIDECRKADDRHQHPAASIPDSQRIAVFAWGGDERDQTAFAQAIFREELPSDVLFAFASILVLQSASRDDLRKLGVTDDEICAGLIADYPHLGLDGETGSYEATYLDCEALAPVLKKQMSALVTKSAFDVQEELVMTWADILLENGYASRACDVMRLICPSACRGPWLVENGWELASRSCFFPTLQLARDQKGLNATLKARMAALEALCRCFLGDEQGSLKAAKRCGFDANAPVDARVCGALVVSRLGMGKVQEQARLILEAAKPDGLETDPTVFQLLAWACHASAEGPRVLSELWREFRDAGAADAVLCICASWLFSLFGRERWAEEERLVSVQDKCEIERFVREQMMAGDERLLDFFAASAGLSLEEAHGRGVSYCEGPLETDSMYRMRNVETEVLSQREAFESEARADRAKRDARMSSHPDSYLDARARFASPNAVKRVPVLKLKLFGHLEVSVGDVPLEQKCFKRQHVRNLLVLLAVNQGREVSRDQLTKSMWPTSSVDVRRKNFYTVWSQLRHILELPDGTCPYLVRQQCGCSFEHRYVTSDVDRLSDICRELLFGKPELERWSELYSEIDRDFACELVPSERSNRMVIQARNEYRARLVDALVAAAYGIVAEGHPQWGIWFARSATRYDETREDAYVALMRAQIAGNQRTAAMMTYLTCRKVLDDQLGIDPSPEATALYEKLLRGEI